MKVFNLDEHNFVELPNVFSTLKLPVSEESIHQKEDVNMYPNLKGILLPKIDACIGLLIGNDVPKALEPKEIRECTEQGPFAIWTMFGWMINSPLERKGNYLHTANFIRADDELSQQFAKFCSLKFSNYIYDNDHALSIMEQSVTLKEGHCKVPLPWRNTLPYFLHNQPLVEHRLKL